MGLKTDLPLSVRNDTSGAPVPSAYQPVMIQRDWVHENTHGMARKSSTVRSPDREAGRDILFRYRLLVPLNK